MLLDAFAHVLGGAGETCTVACVVSIDIMQQTADSALPIHSKRNHYNAVSLYIACRLSCELSLPMQQLSNILLCRSTIFRFCVVIAIMLLRLDIHETFFIELFTSTPSPVCTILTAHNTSCLPTHSSNPFAVGDGKRQVSTATPATARENPQASSKCQCYCRHDRQQPNNMAVGVATIALHRRLSC